MTDLAEERLSGGHDTEEVVRIGDTVRRTRRSGSEFAAQVLRYLHSVGYTHAPRYLGVDEQGRDMLTRGSFNTICQDGLPVAFIDWDGCSPGSRLDDVGYLAWTWCIQTLGNVPIADQARHLRELRDGYGDVEPERLVAAMIQQQTRIIDAERINLHDGALTAARRDHARNAIAWPSPIAH